MCNLCSGIVTTLLRLDRRRVLTFGSLQGEFGQRIIAEHSLQSLDSFVLVDGDRISIESDAVLDVIAKLGGGWRIVTVLRVVPRPMRNALYRWIARHRIGWFGQPHTCMVPTPELRARFVD